MKIKNTIRLGMIFMGVSSTLIACNSGTSSSQNSTENSQATSLNMSQAESVTTRATIFSPYKDVTIGLDWSAYPQPYTIATQVTESNIDPDYGQKPIPLLDVLPAGMNAVTWAFATGDCSDSGDTLSWAGISGDDIASGNVKSFTVANVDYIISTGGENGKFTCGSGTTGNPDGMKSFLDRYSLLANGSTSKNFAGVDFDIEGSQLTNDQTTSLVNSLAAVKTEYPGQYGNLRVSFTLSALAYSDGQGQVLNPGGQMVMNAIGSAGLQGYYINLMTMDYGDPADPSVCVMKSGTNQCDMGKSAIQAVKNFEAEYPYVPESHIEITPLIGVNDFQDEVFTTTDATSVANFVRDNGLGGLHYWSFDRDTACTWQRDLGSTCNGMTNPTLDPLTFANTFIQGLQPNT